MTVPGQVDENPAQDSGSGNSDLQEQVNQFRLSELKNEIREIEKHYEYLDLKINVFFSQNLEEVARTFLSVARRLRFQDIVGRITTGLRSRTTARAEPHFAFPHPDRRIFNAMKQPRIFIDTTPLRQPSAHRGVNRMLEELARSGATAGSAVPVYLRNGRPACRFADSPVEENVVIGEDDILVIGHSPDGDDRPLIQRNMSRSRTLILLNDALWDHETMRDACSPLASAEAVIVPSRAAAERLLAWARDNDRLRPPLKRVGWWTPGADLHPVADAPALPVASIDSGLAPYFLSVGTLELSSAYPVALAAFDRLWLAGSAARWVIVGACGRDSRSLEARITGHPEFGKKLVWLKGISDAELRHLYQRARALVACAIDGMSGQTLAEAAYEGLPAVASDIPVFRESGNDATRYFPVLDSDALESRLREALLTPKPALSRRQVIWKDASVALLDMIREDRFQWRIDEHGQPVPFA